MKKEPIDYYIENPDRLISLKYLDGYEISRSINVAYDILNLRGSLTKTNFSFIFFAIVSVAMFGVIFFSYTYGNMFDVILSGIMMTITTTMSWYDFKLKKKKKSELIDKTNRLESMIESEEEKLRKLRLAKLEHILDGEEEVLS